jgi:hypothetical protein
MNGGGGRGGAAKVEVEVEVADKVAWVACVADDFFLESDRLNIVFAVLSRLKLSC